AHAVVGVAVAAPDLDHAGLVRLAAAVEADSEHPLARAVVAAAGSEGDGCPRPQAGDFRSLTGRGVEATVDGVPVAGGGPALRGGRGLAAPAALAAGVAGGEDRGAAVLSVVRDGAVVGALALEDEVRPEARQAVAALAARGVEVAMVTGDARPVAAAVAA